MNRTRMRAALVASGAGLALLASAGPASADTLSDLKAEMDEVKARLAKLEADRAARTKKRRMAPAAAVEEGDKPKSWMLPGTRTSMSVGGYAKLDFIYDFNGALGDGIGVGTGVATPGINSIPLRGTGPANVQGHFLLHAKQSRIWVRTWTPTDWGELATHLEVDFFNPTNTLRLRHAYGRLGPVLAGQTWSTFMAIQYLPETIDFVGPSGQLFQRRAMVRYSHRLGPATTLMVAVEDPNFGPGEAALIAFLLPLPFTATPAGPSFMPDLILAVHHRFKQGGIYAAGGVWGLAVDTGGPTLFGGPPLHDRALGWGVMVAGSFRITPRAIVGGGFAYGNGMTGKFLNNSDVVFVVNSNSPVFPFTSATIDPVPGWGGYAWGQFRWTRTLRSNAVFGFTYQDVAGVTDPVPAFAIPGGKAGIPAGIDHWNYTIHANLIWSPIPEVNFGIEYIYAFRSVYNFANGFGHRAQIGMQYKF